MKFDCARLLFALWVILASSELAFAQEPGQPRLGTKIRVTITHASSNGLRASRLTGVLTDLSDSTLGLRRLPGEPVTALSREDITRVESLVHGDQHLQGAARGFLLGAIIGAMVGFSGGDDPPGLISLSAETKALLDGTLFAFTGAILGLILAPGEKWQEVELNPIEFSFRVSAGGEGCLQIGFRF